MRKLAAIMFPLAGLSAFLATVVVATFPWENVEPGQADLALYVAAAGIVPSGLTAVAIWRRASRAAVALFIASVAIYTWWGFLFAQHPVT